MSARRLELARNGASGGLRFPFSDASIIASAGAALWLLACSQISMARRSEPWTAPIRPPLETLLPERRILTEEEAMKKELALDSSDLRLDSFEPPETTCDLACGETYA
jgi:hypothetical protein